MLLSYSTFCNDALVDASISHNPIKNSPPVMCLAISTDQGELIHLNFKCQDSFKAFCKKHNFELEDKRSE